MASKIILVSFFLIFAFINQQSIWISCKIEIFIEFKSKGFTVGENRTFRS